MSAESFPMTLTSTSIHRLSGFFKALSEPYEAPVPSSCAFEDYDPPEPIEPSPDSSPPSESEEQSGTVNTPILSSVRLASTHPSKEPASFYEKVVNEPIYRPHGKWEWVAGQDLEDIEEYFLSGELHFYVQFPRMHLLIHEAAGAMCSAFVKVSKIGDSEIKYICKS
jgi:hypothetical protein